MTDLNSRWLRSFTILCEERHFTRAAERLNMTQPGMSQHVAKLEQQIGQRLIERDAPSFLLTEAGEKTLSLAKARWRAEQDFLDGLGGADPDAGTARLACSGSFAVLLYPVLMDWMAGSPDLSVHLTAAPEERIVEGVLSGAFDLGVVTDHPRHPHLGVESLGAEQLDLILPGTWADRVPSFDDLQTLGYVQHPDGAGYAQKVLGANYAGEFRGVDGLRIRSFVNQIGQIPAPVAAGIGYTILPRSGVLAFSGRDQVTTVDCAVPTQIDLKLIALKGRQQGPRTRKLAEFVRTQAEALA